MEDRIWVNLANIKFKAIYISKLSKLEYVVGNLYSLFLAITSTGSVAAWSIWNSCPTLWAVIVGISQVLHVAKPYIPLVKTDKELVEMALKYDHLYLQYEKLWYENLKENANHNSIEKEFYKLRDVEHEIDKRYKNVFCPELAWLMKKADVEANNYLSVNFT